MLYTLRQLGNSLVKESDSGARHHGFESPLIQRSVLDSSITFTHKLRGPMKT